MMRRTRTILNLAVAAVLTFTATSVAAQDAPRLPDLLAQLAQPDNEGWRRLERQITTEWSKSGSPAMDLLLQRGREAIREDDLPAAIEHLTALTDHAPDFAEGWNARATAYFRAGHYGPALDDITRTLALNPHHFGALAGLGAILRETGNKAGALAAYKAALAIHPHMEQVIEATRRLETELAGQSI
jgi:Flp pilus assembly protein TadD